MQHEPKRLARTVRFSVAGCVSVLALLIAAPGDCSEPPPSREGREALATWQVLVGEWRGVGQPRRGSTRGNWREEMQWQWQFNESGAALVFHADGAKYFRHGELRWRDDEAFALTLTPSDDEAQPLKFRGDGDNPEQLVFDAESGEGSVARVTIRTVADGDRMLMLLERRIGTSGRFARLAEIGFTREGSGFGRGVSYRECVVTGGLGTIAVEHEGNTYYVCCGGCRDLFQDDPEGVLEEYRQSKAAED